MSTICCMSSPLNSQPPVNLRPRVSHDVVEAVLRAGMSPSFREANVGLRIHGHRRDAQQMVNARHVNDNMSFLLPRTCPGGVSEKLVEGDSFVS